MNDKINSANSKYEVYKEIPYFIINQELDGSGSDIGDEFNDITKYYEIYRKGSKFNVEGNRGDFVSASLKYKKSSALINKEARFLFGEKPDITVTPEGDVGKATQSAKDDITTMNNIITKILDANKFEEILLKAAKDCFIGKRIAGVANFNEEDGVTISFIPSRNFIYETKLGNNNIITKFVYFVYLNNKLAMEDKRIFKKKYVLEQVPDKVTGKLKSVCYIEETIYDGVGKQIEVVTPYQETLLNKIPVVVITNDGLTGEMNGESEIEWLYGYEEYYSKLSNADIDTGRKNMNPVKYTIDMNGTSTKNLSVAPGSYWDLQSNQNLDSSHPAIGVLESSMAYSTALDSTLKRIKSQMYEQVDMPDISLETMTGVITSGKAMKCVYWPLIVRCKEKLKTWKPALQSLVKIIIEGAIAYPNCLAVIGDDLMPIVSYQILIDENYPLPEDEEDEKALDLQEVMAQTMSKKAYMKKWRSLTDDEADEEIEQMAYEKSILEDGGMDMIGDSGTLGSEEAAPITDTEEEEPEEEEEVIDEEEDVEEEL